MKKGHWKSLSSKLVYQNPWIKVKEDKVIRPDGKKGIFGLVSMVPGVTVLAKDKKNNVYLTKEYCYTIKRESIEGISGAIEKGESKLQAAKRELKEEAGLMAEKWTYLGFVDPFTSVVNSPNHLFLAQNLTKTKSNLEGTENLKIIKVSFNKAFKWVMESKITHSGSVALILKVKELNENQ